MMNINNLPCFEGNIKKENSLTEKCQKKPEISNADLEIIAKEKERLTSLEKNAKI